MAESARKPFWKSPFTTVLIGLAVVAALTTLNRNGGLESLELAASDRIVYHNMPAPPPSGVVVIAGIDDKSIAELGRWPWGRDVEARVVAALKDYQAAVVGFDVLMTERDSADVEREQIAADLAAAGVNSPSVRAMLARSNDAEFARAIAAQGATFLGYTFSSVTDPFEPAAFRAKESNVSGFRTTFADPPPLFYNLVRKTPGALDATMTAAGYLPPIDVLNRAARGSGYVYIDHDADGAVRSIPAVFRFRGRYCAPLFLALADAFAGFPPLGVQLGPSGVAGVSIARLQIPVDEVGRMIIHFRGSAGSMPSYSIADIVDHRLPPDALRGKIVLVGLTGRALGDRVVTPVSGDYPGVEVQASAVDNVLSGGFLVSNGKLWFAEEWAGIAIGAAISIAAAYLTAVASAGVGLLLGTGYLAWSMHLLRTSGEELGVVFPLLTLAITYIFVISWRYAVEGREKWFIRHAFEHYLNPEVIASLVDNPEGLKLGGERRHLAILFSDIVNFTSRTERSDPEPLVALLNTYMTVMTNLILECGGTVDKLMGDGIMAFWGAPAPMKNPARAAIACAIRMMEELRRLAATDERFSDMRIGIGICAGEAIVGNFGGERSFDYSAIGDTVNLASRLEGLTRQFKVGILVNKQAYSEAGDGFVGREIGLVKVKGKDQLVPVVEVAGRAGDGADPAYYDRFARALAAMRDGVSPEPELRAMLGDRPDDRVIAMCLERLGAAGANHPHELVFEFDTK
jgi:adenylate cyclase